MYAKAFRPVIQFTVLVSATFLFAQAASAAVIVGGGGLMSQAYANKIDGWLGEGPLQFTNVYTKQTGDNSIDFHAAADGKGRTVTLIELLSTNAYYQTLLSKIGHTIIPDQVIGGYNPQSWTSSSYYNMLNSDAFVFNLSTNSVHFQDPSNSGDYQTFNHADYGPTFGGGYDIYVNKGLTSGSAIGLSYGPYVNYDINPYYKKPIVSMPDLTESDVYYVRGIRIGRIEVYTLSSAPAAVPEPATIALWGLGAAGVAALRFRRRRKTQGESLSASA